LEGLVVDKNFWKGKKVFVTGHTGFKGSWLSLWLQHLGAEVIGISLDPPTQSNIYEQANVAEGMLSLREDIRNGEAIKQLFQRHKPEIVFHLAAQPLVRYSYHNPVETYQTNVMGTLHILEGIRSIDTVRSAVMITTDKCYQNKEWVWGYRETDSLGGHDPYSSSKGAAELLISSYRDSYFPMEEYKKHKTAIASARAGNVIGGGDWATDRLIPDIIRAFQNGKKVVIRNPASTRPWQHVLEPLSGYLKLAELLYKDGFQYADAWNFGPRDEDARPVQWIAKKMAKQWGGGADWIVNSEKIFHEANYLKLDCSKAYTKLKWKPKWNLDKALSNVIRWHKIEYKQGDCRKICLEQIVEYISDKK
jgi:CDP-glucose 4,6-dehydratase